MQLTTVLVSFALLTASAQACFFDVRSSTVGTFKAQHSEPKDHDGAPQTITGGKNACSFSGNLLDGCIVQVRSNRKCGTLTFTRNGNN